MAKEKKERGFFGTLIFYLLIFCFIATGACLVAPIAKSLWNAGKEIGETLESIVHTICHASWAILSAFFLFALLKRLASGKTTTKEIKDGVDFERKTNNLEERRKLKIELEELKKEPYSEKREREITELELKDQILEAHWEHQKAIKELHDTSKTTSNKDEKAKEAIEQLNNSINAYEDHMREQGKESKLDEDFKEDVKKEKDKTDAKELDKIEKRAFP